MGQTAGKQINWENTNRWTENRLLYYTSMQHTAQWQCIRWLLKLFLYHSCIIFFIIQTNSWPLMKSYRAILIQKNTYLFLFWSLWEDAVNIPLSSNGSLFTGDTLMLCWTLCFSNFSNNLSARFFVALLRMDFNDPFICWKQNRTKWELFYFSGGYY